MRKMISIFGLVVLFTTLLAGCGKTASDYNYLVKEYKEVVCIQ
jgi:outer membrane murein-binding lipoprotein Lpp